MEAVLPGTIRVIDGERVIWTGTKWKKTTRHDGEPTFPDQNRGS